MLLKPKQCSSLTVITQTNKQTKQQQVFSKWDELHYTQADNDVSCSLVQRRTLQMMAAAYKKCLVVCCITAEAAAAFPFPRWRSTEQMVTSTKTVHSFVFCLFCQRSRSTYDIIIISFTLLKEIVSECFCALVLDVM